MIFVVLIAAALLAAHAADADAVRQWRIPERRVLASGTVLSLLGAGLLLVHSATASTGRLVVGRVALAVGLLAVVRGEVSRHRRRDGERPPTA